MKFRYIGDLDECTIRDVTFQRGKAAEVSEDMAEKLRGIPVFTEVKPGRPSNADKK